MFFKHFFKTMFDNSTISVACENLSYKNFLDFQTKKSLYTDLVEYFLLMD